jgi:hypothetical protein
LCLLHWLSGHILFRIFVPLPDCPKNLNGQFDLF